MNQITSTSTYSDVDFWKTKNAQFSGIAPIDHLFNRLDGLYVGKWRAAFSNDSAIKNWREAWSEAFVEEAVTGQEIKAGIAACRKLYEWPPSFTQFLIACRPATDYESAYHEAVEQSRLRLSGKDTWSCPAIFWAYVGIGADISKNPYVSIKTRWKVSLNNSRESIASGFLANEVPERKVELPAPGKTTVSKEESAKRFAAIREVLEKKIIITVDGK